MELYGNRNHQIYLPHPIKAIGHCVGETYFFKNKFWKLIVMFGQEWSSLGYTTRGLSYFNRGSKDKLNWVFEKLDKMGIKYTTGVSPQGWNININISSRKANLDIIEKEYKKYYSKTKNSHKDFIRYENYIVSEDWKKEWLEEYPHHINDFKKI